MSSKWIHWSSLFIFVILFIGWLWNFHWYFYSPVHYLLSKTRTSGFCSRRIWEIFWLFSWYTIWYLIRLGILKKTILTNVMLTIFVGPVRKMLADHMGFIGKEKKSFGSLSDLGEWIDLLVETKDLRYVFRESKHFGFLQNKN